MTTVNKLRVYPGSMSQPWPSGLRITSSNLEASNDSRFDKSSEARTKIFDIVDQRLAELKQKIQQLAATITPGQVFQGYLESAITPPSLDSQKINLPFHFLLKASDIPTNCRNPDSEDSVQAFGNWLNDRGAAVANNAGQAVPAPVNPKELKEILKQMLDASFETQKDFVIAHELSHACPENKSVFVNLGERAMRNLIIAALVVGITLLVVGIVLCPFVGVILGLILAGIGLGYITLTLFSMHHGILKCREIEQRCDLNAAQKLNNATGGIAYFEHLLSKHAIEHKRNDKDDTTELLLKSRIENLKQWEKTRQGLYPG